MIPVPSQAPPEPPCVASKSWSIPMLWPISWATTLYKIKCYTEQKFNDHYVIIYLRSCQDILSFFIDSSVVSGPTFAHCSNPSQTNNSVECRIFAHEHTKISSWSVSCGNIFDWSAKRSKVGFRFPSLISMISVTANSLLKKFCFLFLFEKWILNSHNYNWFLSWLQFPLDYWL